ncbi:MAG: P-loop NTPase fold protein [Bacilli bacterium]|nr:P-loop NTPase fold protein [Bacilli bacterium]
MDFLYDEPIKCESDDLLNRTKFARDFVLNLLSIPKGKNMTISINGEWGSGKTSLINLIKVELKKELSNRSSISDKSNFYYQIVDFAPWNTLDENAIVNQFFNTLISNFSEEKVKNFLKSEYYKGFISIAKEMPKVGVIFKGMDVLLKKYSKSFLKGDENLLEIKEKINKKLQSLPGKFIIFIDDIDRLNKKEIKLLIQLIKAVFDFPNIIYILAFDKKIVSDALSEEQSVTGEEYLEKIIQLSINIPQIEELVKVQFLVHLLLNKG